MFGTSKFRIAQKNSLNTELFFYHYFKYSLKICEIITTNVDLNICRYCAYSYYQAFYLKLWITTAVSKKYSKYKQHLLMSILVVESYGFSVSKASIRHKIILYCILMVSSFSVKKEWMFK